MPYGDYSGEDKPNKGFENGACNVTTCQAEPATHYNHGSYRWYCADCAVVIGQDPVNKRGWDLSWKPECGHDQFETREQIDAREAAKPDTEVGLDDILDYRMFPEMFKSKSTGTSVLEKFSKPHVGGMFNRKRNRRR